MVGIIADIKIDEIYENEDNNIVESKRCMTRNGKKISPKTLKEYLKNMGEYKRHKYVLEEVLCYTSEADSIKIDRENSEVNFVNLHSNNEETEEWVKNYVDMDSRTDSINEFLKKINRREKKVAPAFRKLFYDRID